MGRSSVRDRLRGERGRALAFVGAWAASLILVWALIGAAAPTPIPAPSEPVEATLLVDGGPWTIQYQAPSVNNTVFRFLREANVTLGFELSWIEYGWPYFDVFITSINGTKMDADRAWQYCVNGAYATVGAANMGLRDGDVVKWVIAPGGGSELCA